MGTVISVAVFLLDTDEVIGRELRRQPVEDQCPVSSDVVERAPGRGGQLAKAVDLEIAVFGHCRRHDRAAGEVAAARDVHQQHIDRRLGTRRRSYDGIDISRVIENQPLRHHNQRFRSIYQCKTVEDGFETIK
mgnify:CR=1 FL=1